MSERQDRPRDEQVPTGEFPDAGGGGRRRRDSDLQRVDGRPSEDQRGADRVDADRPRDSRPGADPLGADRLGGVSLPEAFALLGHEDRLAIVATVVRARDAPSREYPVPFSTLRDATGFRDTGRLAYHLGELTGRFLVRTDGGYAVDERGFDVLRIPLAQYADGR